MNRGRLRTNNVSGTEGSGSPRRAKLRTCLQGDAKGLSDRQALRTRRARVRLRNAMNPPDTNPQDRAGNTTPTMTSTPSPGHSAPDDVSRLMQERRASTKRHQAESSVLALSCTFCAYAGPHLDSAAMISVTVAFAFALLTAMFGLGFAAWVDRGDRTSSRRVHRAGSPLD